MKKRLLSLLLSMAILLSLCTGLGMSASAAGSFVKVTSLSVGDRVVLVTENPSEEFSGISNTSTKYGTGAPYSGEPGGIVLLEVCAGFSSDTYAFKAPDGRYLYWTSGNSLNLNATLQEKTSWKVSFDSSGNATILNSADTARQIWWNESSPRFACYTGKTSTTTGYATVQLYKATGTVCDHATTTYTEPTPPTCTEKGVGVYTCTECGVSWDVIVKAKGHDYGYAKVNNEIYRDCSGCDSLEPVTMNTIDEAKSYKTSGNKGPYNIRGVVTYIKVSTKATTVYIEDGIDALCVYFTNNANVSHLRLGNEIFVSDTMTDYYGLPELKTDECLVLSSNNPLPNKTITIRDIMNDQDIFEYLGERVTLKEVTIGLVASKGYTPLTDNSRIEEEEDGGNGDIVVDDGNDSEGENGENEEEMQGDSIYIYASPKLNSDIEGGDIVDVTGVISYYNGDFQILVNESTALTDVVKVRDGVPLIKETVPISFAKKCTQKGRYFQIEGIVTCVIERQIFLQDETGGMVVYLATMPTEAPCAVGDKIRVFGLFGNYNGVLELQYVDHTDPECFSILSHDHQVVAQPVTIEQLLFDSAIDYELFAEKIFLDDVSILEIETDGTVLLWQNDYTIEIHEAPVLNEGCVLDAVVDVTATVSGHNFDYQLVIMSPDQVTYGSQCQHSEVMPVGSVAPGCKEYGYSGDLYCTLCGAFVSKGQSVPPAHQETTVVGEVLPTCTTDGFSGDVYCALCGVLIESGKTVPATHTMVTENDVDPTCEEAGYSGDQYCAVCGMRAEQGEVLPALGHDYDILNMIIEPTCTEPGLAVYICDRCNISYEGEIPPAGHNSIYTDHGQTHSYICFDCGASGEEEHEYFEGFCMYCGAVEPERIPVDESIVIRHTLNLASDISINFVVDKSLLDEYDMFYLECVRDTYSGNESTGSESVIIDAPVLSGNYYYFTLTGVNATQMNDEVSATLYMIKGDKIYCSNEDIYSVATYAYSQLNKSNAGADLKKVCADLLHYGSAAQIYKKYRTDELTDAAMTDVHKSYLTDLDTVTFGKNSINHADLTSPTITWEGKSLVMDSKIVLRFIFGTNNYKGDVNNLTLRVTYTDNSGKQVSKTVSNPTPYRVANGWYAFDFDGLLAAELRTVVSVAIYNGNTRVSETFSYSADTYGNGKTGDLLTVSKAMLAYSDAACAYFYGK